MIPFPTLAELHRRAAAGDASAQAQNWDSLRHGTDIAPDECTALDWIGRATVRGTPLSV